MITILQALLVFEHFNSHITKCQKVVGVDAFSVDWSGDNNWLVPPIHLIPVVLNHIQVCKARGTLVLPEWPSAVFWPLLFSNSSPFKGLISQVLRFGESDNIFIHGKNPEAIFGCSKMKSAVLCLMLQG